jgi:hypothetical protein
MAYKGKGPDWTKTGTVVAYAEWLREKSGALAVVVVRRDDAALAADLTIKVADVGERIMDDLPALVLDLPKARAEKRKAARLERGPISE